MLPACWGLLSLSPIFLPWGQLYSLQLQATCWFHIYLSAPVQTAWEVFLMWFFSFLFHRSCLSWVLWFWLLCWVWLLHGPKHSWWLPCWRNFRILFFPWYPGSLFRSFLCSLDWPSVLWLTKELLPDSFLYSWKLLSLYYWVILSGCFSCILLPESMPEKILWKLYATMVPPILLQ